jgi:hypothetical protein
MRVAMRLLSVLSVCSLAATAFAVPVVKPGGKPGAAASWKTDGANVVLKLTPGFEASAVAKAIQGKVQGVTAKAAGADVSVSGMPEAKLLAALEAVDAGEPASGYDVDALLANLRNPSDGEEDQSGSSIRATSAADFSAVMGNKEELISAKVVDVKRQKFPLVLVTVKIAAVPKGLTLPGIKAGSKITVLPRVKSKNGVIDPTDEPSQLNLGAWYVEPNDNVMLRLEKDPKDANVWIAAAFDRRVK